MKRDARRKSILPELDVSCFAFGVSIPAPIKFMIFSICLKRRHPILFYIYQKYQHLVLYTCLDLTLIKDLQGPRITIEQFFVLVTQAQFTRYWI